MEPQSYSLEELAFFRKILEDKLTKAHEDLQALHNALAISQESVDKMRIKNEEDGAEDDETEKVSLLAVRQQQFIEHLEAALDRIKKSPKTYGICVTTGQRIEKERLIVAPHTTHSVVAKQRRDQTDAG